MTRDELIDAGARALYDDAEEGPSLEAEERRAGCWSLAEDVIDAVEAWIRTDEQDKCYRLFRATRDRDLRARVEAALETAKQVARDHEAEGATTPALQDRAAVFAYARVIDMIDGGSDDQR